MDFSRLFNEVLHDPEVQALANRLGMSLSGSGVQQLEAAVWRELPAASRHMGQHIEVERAFSAGVLANTSLSWRGKEAIKMYSDITALSLLQGF